MNMEDQNSKSFPNLKHLINEHGILKSFNVNRRVNKQEINRIAQAMGMDIEKIDFDEIHSIISTISSIEYSCGEVPGTENSNSRSVEQYKKNYKKLNKLMSYSVCVLDLLNGEQLSLNEKIFIINKCLVDLQSKNKND